jgi:hypothetical protein
MRHIINNGSGDYAYDVPPPDSEDELGEAPEGTSHHQGSFNAASPASAHTVAAPPVSTASGKPLAGGTGLEGLRIVLPRLRPEFFYPWR